MSYLHIENLYRDQSILLFKECYASEKIHGTSAHIAWNGQHISFFAGGAKQATFEALFNLEQLQPAMALLGDSACVFGEAYGGKLQGMKATYGDQLKFVAFEVRIGDCWLAMPDAEQIVKSLGLEFVHYVKIPATLEAIEAEMKAESVQAIRNGMGSGKVREGVVLRPLIEVRKNNKERIIAKHKNDIFKETVGHRVVGTTLPVLVDGEKIADEWVTRERLGHVLDAIQAAGHPEQFAITDAKLLIDAMLEDVFREGKGEVVDSHSARKAISKRTMALFKERRLKGAAN